MYRTARSIKPEELAETINKHAELGQQAINELTKMKEEATKQCSMLETEKRQLQVALDKNKVASANQRSEIEEAESTLQRM